MKRVLLKLSGEALAGEKKTGFDEATCIGVAKQVKQLVDEGIQVAIVTGGGNFWRGRTSETIDRTKADQIGMLATVMNCIYVSDIFRHVGMKTEVIYTVCMWCFYFSVFQGCSNCSTGRGKSDLLCRRNRTSVFLYRYRSSTSCHRDRGRCNASCKGNRRYL